MGSVGTFFRPAPITKMEMALYDFQVCMEPSQNRGVNVHCRIEAATCTCAYWGKTKMML